MQYTHKTAPDSFINPTRQSVWEVCLIFWLRKKVKSLCVIPMILEQSYVIFPQTGDYQECWSLIKRMIPKTSYYWLTQLVRSCRNSNTQTKQSGKPFNSAPSYKLCGCIVKKKMICLHKNVISTTFKYVGFVWGNELSRKLSDWQLSDALLTG